MRKTVRNILFIMCDQLRADYLSSYGHRRLDTPHIDALARRGVRFTRAYCQSPNCGPSRASFYTGRYVYSHGATWNFIPPAPGERFMGDYLRSAMRVAVVGKTHVFGDLEGMQRLGIDAQGEAGRLLGEGGFEPWERDDGVHPDSRVRADLRYNRYLRSHGMDGANPWHSWANAGLDENGELASGWYLRNAHRPTRAPDEHGETAYMTRRAMDFIAEQGERPWLLHLSYIKPHWPYIAAAPYHGLYGPQDIQAPVRSLAERHDDHPVYAGFREQPEALAFSDDSVRRHVIPAYMGLVKQVDDHLGKLFAFLEAQGRLEDTLIVFTSDHGDYLGDHWLGEKECMFEQGVRIPLIISDPGSPETHGTVSDALVEAIDLLPTFIDTMGLPVPWHVLEGQSLRPVLQAQATKVREVAISELDYEIYGVARKLRLPPRGARMVMVRSDRWKYIHYDGLPPQLFDMTNDPQELRDLGRDPGHERIRQEHVRHLLDWTRRRRNRICFVDEQMARWSDPAASGAVVIGQW